MYIYIYIYTYRERENSIYCKGVLRFEIPIRTVAGISRDRRSDFRTERATSYSYNILYSTYIYIYIYVYM